MDLPASRIRRNSSRKHFSTRRRGAALIELAVCLPLILTIVLGMIEVTSIIYCKQTLQVTAHECARLAAKPNATDAAVQARLAEFADQLQVQNATVQTVPASIEDLAPGTRFKVIVTASANQNTFVSGNFYPNANIVAACVFVKEI